MRYHVVIGGGRVGTAVALSHVVRGFDARVSRRLVGVFSNSPTPDADSDLDTAVLWIDDDSEFGAPLRTISKKTSPSSAVSSSTTPFPVDCFPHPLTAMLPPMPAGVPHPVLRCVSPQEALAILNKSAEGGVEVASVSVCTPLDTLCGTFTGSRFHLNQPQGTSGGGLFYKDTHETAANNAVVGASKSIVDICKAAASTSPIYIFTRGVSEHGRFPVDVLKGALSPTVDGVNNVEPWDLRVVCGPVVPHAWAEESCHLLNYLHSCASELIPQLAAERRSRGTPTSTNADVQDMNEQHADLEQQYWVAAAERGTLLPPYSPTMFSISSLSSTVTTRGSVAANTALTAGTTTPLCFTRETVNDISDIGADSHNAVSTLATSFLNSLALVLPSICGTMSVVGWGGSNSHVLPYGFPTPEPSSSASLVARMAFEQTTVEAISIVLAHLDGTSSSPATTTRLAATLVNLSISDSSSSDFIAGRRYGSFGTLGAMLPSSYSVGCPHLHAQDATYSGILSHLEAIQSNQDTPSHVKIAANTLTNLVTFQRGIECRLTTKAKCAMRSDATPTALMDRPYDFWLREEEMSFRQGHTYRSMRRVDEAIVSGEDFKKVAKEAFGIVEEDSPTFNPRL